MDALQSFKSQFATSANASSILDEYGAYLCSWLLENELQSDVEQVIQEHLLPNEALLDHCSWEILPILYRRSWMTDSPVVVDLFSKIPPKEVVLHTISAYPDMEGDSKAQALKTLIRTIPRLLPLDSKRAIVDVLNLAVDTVPPRYTKMESGNMVNQGEKYGLQSAEDTSESGQFLTAPVKASLLRFLPLLLDEFNAFVSLHATSVMESPAVLNMVLAALFRLSHCVASFQAPPPEYTTLLPGAPPLPPSLTPPKRPTLPSDPDLNFLLEAANRIWRAVEKLGRSPFSLLLHPNTLSQARIHAASSSISAPGSSTAIPVPAIQQNQNCFDPAGVAACLYSALSANASRLDNTLILNPALRLSLLLEHSQALLTSRSVLGLFFVLLHVPRDLPVCIIAYSLPYIIEQEFLPQGVPQHAYLAIKGCIEFGIRTPDTKLRQLTMLAINSLVKLFDLTGRYKLIYLLTKTCPYPSALGLMVHLMKECFLEAHTAASNGIQEAITSPFFSPELFMGYFAKLTLTTGGLETRGDAISAALNFLRFLLIRDSDARLSAIWNSSVSKDFKKTVIVPLTSGVLQIIAQHQKDDSFEDRLRIRKDISSKGMGTMSLDQLQVTQAQTILNWQLVHSLLTRIEELLPAEV